jgi:hypothetical protein
MVKLLAAVCLLFAAPSIFAAEPAQRRAAYEQLLAMHAAGAQMQTALREGNIEKCGQLMRGHQPRVKDLRAHVEKVTSERDKSGFMNRADLLLGAAASDMTSCTTCSSQAVASCSRMAGFLKEAEPNLGK